MQFNVGEECKLKYSLAAFLPAPARVQIPPQDRQGVAFDAAEMFHGRWLLGQELKAKHSANYQSVL